MYFTVLYRTKKKIGIHQLLYKLIIAKENLER